MNQVVKQLRGRLSYIFFAVALLLLILPQAVFGLSAGQVSVTLITPFMALDSNNPCVQGPSAGPRSRCCFTGSLRRESMKPSAICSPASGG